MFLFLNILYLNFISVGPVEDKHHDNKVNNDDVNNPHHLNELQYGPVGVLGFRFVGQASRKSPEGVLPAGQSAFEPIRLIRG